MNNFKHVPKYPVQTLSKALDILTYIRDNPSSEGVTLTEVSSALGIGKSGVHRLLDTLMAYDFIEKINGVSPAYRLGWGLFNAGNAVPKQHTLNGANYMPLIEKLCNTFLETVNLGILNNYETIIICKMEPAVMLRTNTRVGEREPAYATALGKLFMTNFSEEEIENYFNKTEMQKLAVNTITDREKMRQALEIIQKQDYAIDNEEYVDGMICVAMPIRDFSGNIAAGISVSGPSKRMTNEKVSKIKPLLKDACSEISEFLGFTKD
ncbi:MAG: IclR family transcriptional regulator [Clostridia bacterium]|jgi:DNA-binding IclR family transcriptional regulator|nr:IclR family transcriptional regulator [Clostridia bacterium]MCI1959586.1 IclR family transcriptional regulator [Clostridia bacterium]MCI2000489.1 IclR family transcriptional regulator [Clostridia bacterium]MCI2014944.1 IclR family transcriptional regulator [Clostridia bacterium]